MTDAPEEERGRPDFPERELARVTANAGDWLNANISYLWPRTVRPDATFYWDLVRTSYCRINIDAGERYVLSLPGTPRFRLRAAAAVSGQYVRIDDDADA